MVEEQVDLNGCVGNKLMFQHLFSSFKQNLYTDTASRCIFFHLEPMVTYMK
jgi:hypothetical protein